MMFNLNTKKKTIQKKQNNNNFVAEHMIHTFSNQQKIKIRRKIKIKKLIIKELTI